MTFDEIQDNFPAAETPGQVAARTPEAEMLLALIQGDEKIDIANTHNFSKETRRPIPITYGDLLSLYIDEKIRSGNKPRHHEGLPDGTMGWIWLRRHLKERGTPMESLLFVYKYHCHDRMSAQQKAYFKIDGPSEPLDDHTIARQLLDFFEDRRRMPTVSDKTNGPYHWPEILEYLGHQEITPRMFLKSYCHRHPDSVADRAINEKDFDTKYAPSFMPDDEQIIHAMIRFKARTGYIAGASNGRAELPENSPKWHVIHRHLSDRGQTFTSFYDNYMLEHYVRTGQTKDQLRQSVLSEANIIPKEQKNIRKKDEGPALTAREVFHEAATYVMEGVIPSVRNPDHAICGLNIRTINAAIRCGLIAGWQVFAPKQAGTPNNLSDFMASAGLVEHNMAGRLEPAPREKIERLLARYNF